MDNYALRAALEAVERSAEDPSAFSYPFVEMFPVSGAAVSTIGDLLGSETVSASDTVAARVDELQFDLGEGPCWDAMNFARPVLEPDIRDLPRSVWPAFSAAIREHPVTSVFAFPLLVGSLRFGAVDLYSADPVSLTSSQAAQAATIASAVGHHVLRRALSEMEGEHQEAGNAYSRRLVHQATGMVLAQLGVSGDDARLIIQGQAFATSRSMMEVAQEIVERRLAFCRGENGIEVSK